MAELEAFSTSVLTSKTPEQSASIVNEGLKQTSQLVQGLITFFEGYINLVQRQNHDLNNLVTTEGSVVTNVVNSAVEHGLITKAWDSYMNVVQQQIQANDQKVKFLKLEIVSPLTDLLHNNIKHSELLINNRELTELASQSPIDEYQWSSKSLQILTNFGNFKKEEKGLIMNDFLGLLNFEASSSSKSLQTSETFLNRILNNFNLDTEMNHYLNVLLDSEPPQLVKAKTKAPHPRSATASSLLSVQEKPKKTDKRQSKLFGHGHSEPHGPGERKKLRSRVGSIFGRRKKKNGDLESIYSAQTTNSNLTNLTNLREDDTVVNNIPELASEAPKELPTVPKSPQMAEQSDSDPELPEPKPAVNEVGNLPPQPHYLDVSKSRFTQYSFETGDDTKFVASPSFQQSQFGEPPLGKSELPEPSVDDDKDKVGDLRDPFAPGRGVSAGAAPEVAVGGQVPAPPPARRVAHNERRAEVQSQMFHSLPATRDSVIDAPHALTSQTTGSSLSKGDLFDHQELAANLVSGLNVSNSQVINVNFKKETLTKASIIGEIAFNYQGTSPNDLVIQLPNQYTKTIVNHIFLTQLGPDSFKVNPVPISNQTLGGIKYMDQKLELQQIPILVHSIWKYEAHQASVMINLQLNPNFKLAIVVKNLVVSVALRTDIESTSASSRPTGTFNKDMNRVTWRYQDEIVLNQDTPNEKLIARFMTNGKGVEDDNGIQLKFSIGNHLEGGVTCNGQPVNVVSNLIAGNYSSQL